MVIGRQFEMVNVEDPYGWWILVDGMGEPAGADGIVVFLLVDSAGNFNFIFNEINIVDNEWHHIMAVYDASQGNILLYVDGEALSDPEGETFDSTDETGFKSPTAPLNIGWFNSGDGYHFNGVIDEVALYNVALPQNIAERHYMQGKPYCGADPGVFRKGAWYLDANGTNKWDAGDTTGSFGISTDIPISGDWNGDGYTSIGVFRNGAWYLDADGSGTWNAGDKTISAGSFGISTDIPITGDWNGDGITNIGIFRNGTWYLDYNGTTNEWDAGDTTGSFGISSDIPITGDWNGDGITNIGVFRNGAWYLDTDGSGTWNAGDTTISAGSFGISTDIPITGDWNGDGITNIGVFRNGAWYLDYNSNGEWDPGVDKTIEAGKFGSPGDIPVTGVWR